MNRAEPPPFPNRFFTALTAFLCTWLCGCTQSGLTNEHSSRLSPQETEALREMASLHAEELQRRAASTEEHPAVEQRVFELLSMSFEEAKALSKAHLEIRPGLRLTCEKLRIVSRDPNGRPRVVRATDKVFLEMGDPKDPIHALCQELVVDRNEVVLRGRPVIARGDSILEGLADDTMAYAIGNRIRFIGLHRLASAPNAAQAAGALFAKLPPLPEIRDAGPWNHSANPLLPPLSPDQVPAKIRAELMKEEPQDLLPPQPSTLPLKP
jgi:hypothetical protein